MKRERENEEKGTQRKQLTERRENNILGGCHHSNFCIINSTPSLL